MTSVYREIISTSDLSDQQLITRAWPNARTWSGCWQHRSVSVLIDRNNQSENFYRERCFLHAKKTVKLIKKVAKELSTYDFNKNENAFITEVNCLDFLYRYVIRVNSRRRECIPPKIEDLNKLVAINARPEILKAFVKHGANPTAETIFIALIRMIDFEAIQFLVNKWKESTVIQPTFWLAVALKYHREAIDLFTILNGKYAENKYSLICIRIIREVNADLQRLPDNYSPADLKIAWNSMYSQAFREEHASFRRAGLEPLKLKDGPRNLPPGPDTIDFWKRRMEIGSCDDYMKFKVSSFAEDYENVSEREYKECRVQFKKYEAIFQEIEKMEEKIDKEYIQPADAFLLHRNEGESSSSMAVEAESEESCLTCIIRLFSSCLQGKAHLD